MSSGTPQNPAAARAMANSLAEGMDREGDPATAFMSPAQQLAATRYAFFRGEQYAGWKTGWDGRPATDLSTRDQIGYSGQMPEGFVDFGASETPAQFRKPDAPYNLPRLVVQRFSDMLFGEAHHPTPRTPGDPETEDWLAGLVEATRLWAQMHAARDLGGSMGTVAFGFFLDCGRPVVELFDRRYCTPTFSNPVTHKLKALEERYAYSVEERNTETGDWENVWYWFRRVIDAQRDRTWSGVPVADGKEPAWDTLECAEVVHGLGEVPVIWLHNLSVPHSADGDPDLLENDLETSTTIDRLTSMANQGITANCLGRETQFITDEGVRSFGDFSDGDAVVVLTHTGAWRRARVRSYGEQELFWVRVGRGQNSQTIRATRAHRWLLADGRTTDDLQPGHKLAKPPTALRDWSYEEASEGEQRAWARGFAYGDGSVLTKGDKRWGTRVRLCGGKARFEARFEELGYGVTHPPHANEEPVVYMRDYQKQLPALKAGGELTAFVRGYLDADGSRNLKHPETQHINPFQGIQVTGEEAVWFVRNAFPLAGAYVVAEDDRTDSSTNYGERGACTVYFSLVCGFSSSPVAPYIVRDISRAEREVVWCLEVEEDHSFVLPNGVVTRNCDPTLVLESDQEFDSVGKGSNAALQVEKGGKATYLEMVGTGSKSAMEQAAILEDRVLRSARCVIEKSHVQVMVGGHATATEKQKDYSAMWSAVGARREQYGEKGVRALLELAIRVCRHAAKPRMNMAAGRLEVQEVILPPKRIEVTVGERKTFIEMPRVLGKATSVTLQWPPYEKPPLQEVKTATDATALAKEKGLITTDVAVRYLAPFFGVDDPAALLRDLKKEEQEKKARAVEAFAQQDNTETGAAQQGGAEGGLSSAKRDEQGPAPPPPDSKNAKPPAPPFTARA